MVCSRGRWLTRRCAAEKETSPSPLPESTREWQEQRKEKGSPRRRESDKATGGPDKNEKNNKQRTTRGALKTKCKKPIIILSVYQFLIPVYEKKVHYNCTSLFRLSTPIYMLLDVYDW